MGLSSRFTDKTIFLDTAPLIYYIEDNNSYAEVLNELFSGGENRKYGFVTSVITLIEVLVLPFREQNRELARKYESILTNSRALKIMDIDAKTAKISARLRADYFLKTPDAIQLAAAICSSADFFLTNDKRLKSITEVEVVTMDDLSFLPK